MTGDRVGPYEVILGANTLIMTMNVSLCKKRLLTNHRAAQQSFETSTPTLAFQLAPIIGPTRFLRWPPCLPSIIAQPLRVIQHPRVGHIVHGTSNSRRAEGEERRGENQDHGHGGEYAHGGPRDRYVCEIRKRISVRSLDRNLDSAAVSATAARNT